MEQSLDETLCSSVKGMTQLYVNEMISETLSLQSKVQSVYNMVPSVSKRRDLRRYSACICKKKHRKEISNTGSLWPELEETRWMGNQWREMSHCRPFSFVHWFIFQSYECISYLKTNLTNKYKIITVASTQMEKCVVHWEHIMGIPNCLPEAVAFELGSQGSGVTD